MKTHIFFSPHLDDAVLSCGALINKLCRLGQEVLVINVFSGSPAPENLSAAALEYFRECGLKTDAMKVRKKEDHAALSSLGCQAKYLNLYESLHRTDENGQFLYLVKEQIFNSDLEKEENVLKSLAAKFTAMLDDEKDCILYIPLGIGSHIDHLLTRAAIEKSFADSCLDLLYYEDIPYVCSLFRGPYQNAVISKLNFKEESFEEMDLNAKFSAILEYQSQIEPLFENVQLMKSLLMSYSSSFSKALYAERYWFNI